MGIGALCVLACDTTGKSEMVEAVALNMPNSKQMDFESLRDYWEKMELVEVAEMV